MKILVMLEGRGGELDRQTIDVGAGYDDTTYDDWKASLKTVSDHIHGVILTWELATGDVIRIEEIVS